MNPSATSPPLHTLASVDELGGFLREGRALLADGIRSGAGGLESARAQSDLMDALIRRMFLLSCERAGVDADRIPLCVIATGGYGRRELSPHSDIDITFLPNRDGDSAIGRVVKEMFTFLMRVLIDSNGMSVGYAYRLLQDLGALDHHTTSGLLDARLVCGSDRLFIRFEEEFWSLFNPADFVFTKLEERRRQREKAGGSPRVVEPDIKEGPGGLRDLQTMVWLTQALHSLPAARVRGERAWERLQQHAGLTREETAGLAAAKESLLRVRAALHVLTGAERDQLVVTRQEEVAELLSAGAPAGPHDARPHSPKVERFMREYYQHASLVARLSDSVMDSASRSRIFLGIGLDCADGAVYPAGPALASEDPLWMLWACEIAQRYGLRFSAEIERMASELLRASPPVNDPRAAGEALTAILASRHAVYPVLQKMADIGILGWLIPEVGRVMDLIPYDPSHDYTVGQHSLYVVRNLDSLRLAEGPEETLELRRIMTEIPSQEQLYLAALLHDAGKLNPDRPHAEVGAELAAQVCARLGWDEQASANVVFLVLHHLLMAETSRLRDLHMEETIRDFVAVVDDPDRLNMLYVLTYADTSAVGSGVWTQVKGRFLSELLHKAGRALSAHETDESGDAGLARARRRLLRELSMENLPPEEVQAHVESMPPGYILNTPLEQMALHVGFVRKARLGEPVIDFHDEPGATYTEVTVCALDDPRPGLLAKIAGGIYAADLDVHSAQVFTRVTPSADGDERIAIDTLFVDFRGRRLTPGKRQEVAANLTAVLTGQTSVQDLLTRRRRPAEIGGPVQRLRVQHVGGLYTVVEVASSDARAMLYRASGALSALGWGIHSARISHFKAQTVGSFYVTGARHLSESEAYQALARLMPVE